jgi:hypothetical protein
MDQILPPELNAFEIDAMRQIAAHPAACHIPSAIKTRLNHTKSVSSYQCCKRPRISPLGLNNEGEKGRQIYTRGDLAAACIRRMKRCAGLVVDNASMDSAKFLELSVTFSRLSHSALPRR